MSDSFATPWTVTHQAPLSVGFLRQKYWSGLPFPSPGDLPDPGIEPRSTCIIGRRFTTWASREDWQENKERHKSRGELGFSWDRKLGRFFLFSPSLWLAPHFRATQLTSQGLSPLSYKIRKENLRKLSALKYCYLQGSSGETDIENRLWTWGEGRRGWDAWKG